MHTYVILAINCCHQAPACTDPKGERTPDESTQKTKFRKGIKAEHRCYYSTEVSSYLEFLDHRYIITYLRPTCQTSDKNHYWHR